LCVLSIYSSTSQAVRVYFGTHLEDGIKRKWSQILIVSGFTP
jgi:hypothetical protein